MTLPACHGTSRRRRERREVFRKARDLLRSPWTYDHLLREPLPRGLVDVVDVELGRGVADKAFQHAVKMVAPAFRRPLRSGDADQRELLGQHFGAQEIVERRDQQTLGQVAGGTEDHHRAGIGRLGLAPRRARDQLRRVCGVRIGGLSSMALLGGVRCRRVALQILGLWFGVDGLVSLDVAAEAEAHGREHLFAERVLLPRAETGEQRRREHVRRHRFLDRGLDRPAALAGILHEAGEILQLRILRQRGGAKIEQPG